MTLKAARVNKSLTRQQAAHLLGISPSTLALYETGKRYPDVPKLKRIEAVYGVEYKDLEFFYN